MVESKGSSKLFGSRILSIFSSPNQHSGLESKDRDPKDHKDQKESFSGPASAKPLSRPAFHNRPLSEFREELSSNHKEQHLRPEDGTLPRVVVPDEEHRKTPDLHARRLHRKPPPVDPVAFGLAVKRLPAEHGLLDIIHEIEHEIGNLGSEEPKISSRPDLEPQKVSHSELPLNLRYVEDGESERASSSEPEHAAISEATRSTPVKSQHVAPFEKLPLLLLPSKDLLGPLLPALGFGTRRVNDGGEHAYRESGSPLHPRTVPLDIPDVIPESISKDAEMSSSDAPYSDFNDEVGTPFPDSRDDELPQSPISATSSPSNYRDSLSFEAGFEAASSEYHSTGRSEKSHILSNNSHRLTRSFSSLGLPIMGSGSEPQAFFTVGNDPSTSSFSSRAASLYLEGNSTSLHTGMNLEPDLLSAYVFADPATKPQPRISGIQAINRAPDATTTLSDLTAASRMLQSSALVKNFHTRMLSVSSVNSGISNRHVNLATLRLSLNFRPGEGERSAYVDTLRKNAGTAYNDTGSDKWKPPTGILPVDLRKTLLTASRFNKLHGASGKKTGVELKHGHLAPRLLAAEVDEVGETPNRFGALGRLSTFQSRSITPTTSKSSASLLSGTGKVSRQSSLGRANTLTSLATSTDLPSTAETSRISRSESVSSSEGSLSDLTDGYYQHPAYTKLKSKSEGIGISRNSGYLNGDGLSEEKDSEDDEEGEETHRLVLANPDWSSEED